jgi:ABC-type multidrug transport system fused ATPase/permease subunit
MKHSIRTRFTLGMIFLFLIILILSVFSGYYMNKLSNKTSAILKENYLSVVYARDMSEGIMNINREVTSGYLMNRMPDSVRIMKEINSVNVSLTAEKNNITEPGEDKLVESIESGFTEYNSAALQFAKSPKSPKSEAEILYLQNKSGDIFQKLLLLSQMNGKALEVKTDDAKASSKSALTKMTILATLCFLIGMSFSFSFASYFNRRFFQLYYGIKEIVTSEFDERLYFDGKDEFYEISLVINEMAEKLKKSKQKMSVTLPDENTKALTLNDIEELKKMLFRIKSMEEQAAALISKLEKKQE